MAASRSHLSRNLQLAQGGLRAVRHLTALELGEGTLLRTLSSMARHRGPAFARDWSFGELLEWAADRWRYKLSLTWRGQSFSFNDRNRRANRVARHLAALGLGPHHGMALMLSNHPRFLDAFFGLQKVGAYTVPVNIGLVGEGLAYIINHSEVEALVCDHETAVKIEAIRSQLPNLKHIWVNADEAPEGYEIPAGMQDFAELEQGMESDGDNPGLTIDPEAPGLLLYTSGTTGLPKAVVSHYKSLRTKPLGLLAQILNGPDDAIYTCLPLFHANALLLACMTCLWSGIPLHLSKRFSASRFWQEVSESGATQFFTIGSMIPVLLKNDPSHWEKDHRVRRVISAACPHDAWVPFETRFGVQLWEGYGAVDGAGVTFFNTGNAPVGSMGRPSRNVTWKLVNEAGREAGVNEPGEFMVFVGNRPESKVPYWKNEKASNEKVVDGWLQSGDLMQKDAKGYLYFVGRNSDSMRVRGENVSAYEVEKVVDAFPTVLESAAFAVPAEMGEDDIMITVIPVEGKTVDPKVLLAYLQGNLPKYAVPTWLEVVPELPKTATHRVIKKSLKDKGVTAAAIRLVPARGDNKTAAPAAPAAKATTQTARATTAPKPAKKSGQPAKPNKPAKAAKKSSQRKNTHA